jgi:hypothetical protein
MRCANSPFESEFGDPCGVFVIPSTELPNGKTSRVLNIIATDGNVGINEENKWEHVSVSILGDKKNTPSWLEICLVKDLFWDEEECVVQYHPAKSDYINLHEGVLHLWKHKNAPFPTPPTICV